MENIKDYFKSLKISVGGVNDTLNGQIYQVELLEYMLQKAHLDFANFGLSTELDEFGTFDDAILKIDNFGVIAVQTKWTKNPKCFKFDSFFSTKDSNFLLYKYFMSLKKIYENNSDIQRVIICTNNTLPDQDDAIELVNSKSKMYVSKAHGDSIFESFKRYTFASSEAMKDEATFNCFKAQFLALELSNLLKKVKDKNNFIMIRSFKNMFVEKLIDPNNKKFKYDLTESTDPFLQTFIDALKERNISVKKTNLSFLMSFFSQDSSDSELASKDMDQLIRLFLEKFELLVDVGRNDLEKEIVPLLQNQFQLKNVKSIKANLEAKIIAWISSLQEGNFFDFQKLSELNNEIKNNITSVKIIDRNTRIFYGNPILEFTVINPKITQFISQDLTKSQKRILYCQSKSGESFFVTMKIYQILKVHLLDTFIFVQTSGPEEYLKDAIEIFKSVRSFRILVLEIDQSSEVFHEIKPSLFQIIREKSTKKIVLISDTSYCPNEPMMEYIKEDSYKLVDLTQDSVDYLLKNIIKFQDRPVQIGSIVSRNLKVHLFLKELYSCKSIGQNVISNEVYDSKLYIPRKLRWTDKIIEEDQLLELKDSQEFLIVVNSAGMGKTSLLNRLAEQIKCRFPHHWIINLTLFNHTRYFKVNHFKDCPSIAEFLITDFLKFESSFEQSLLKEAILNEGNAQIILDGLDEIAPNYTDAVLSLIVNLRKLPVKKIIVSTRPELGELLEKTFKKKPFQILSFSREEQEAFLINFWKQGPKNHNETHLKDFASELLDSINESMTSDEEFTGIPLSTKLIGEIYKSQVNDDNSQIDKVEGASNLFELFNQFLEEKLRINWEEKMKLEITNVQNIRITDTDREMLIKSCQKLALPIVFSSEELKSFPRESYLKLNKNEFQIILKYGFVTGNEKFIHKTIAEFFALLYLLMNLGHEKIFIFFVSVVLVDKRFQVLRTMFNSFLKNPSENFDADAISRDFNDLEVKYEKYKCFSVAWNDEYRCIVELLLNSLFDVSDPRRIEEVKEHLTDRKSILISYFTNVEDEFGMLRRIADKFGIDFVKSIFLAKFTTMDGVETELLSSSLSNKKNPLYLVDFCFKHFAGDQKFLDETLKNRDKFSENYLFKFLELHNDRIHSDEFLLIWKRWTTFTNEDLLQWLESLDPSSLKEIIKIQNRNFSLIGDYDFAENYYRIVLNYFDKIESNTKYSTFEKLLSRAFEKFVVKYGVHELISPNIFNASNTDSILLDLEILCETSDGFEFTHPSIIDNFGFLGFLDTLSTRKDLNLRSKMDVCNLDKLIKSLSLPLTIFEKFLSTEDYNNLRRYSVDIFFEKNNFAKFYNETLEIESSLLFQYKILSRVDDRIEFVDPTFINYFAIKDFHEYLKWNFEREETAKMCSNLLHENGNGNFLDSWFLIERFYENQLMKNNLNLHKLAQFGEERENLFFLLLQILLDCMKDENYQENAKKIFTKTNTFRESFLHILFLNKSNWSLNSFKILFEFLKQFKVYLTADEFKEFFMFGSDDKETFVNWISDFDLFELVFNFIRIEFDIEIVHKILVIENKIGSSLWCIKPSIKKFTKMIMLFTNTLDQEYVKEILMQKNDWNESFLLTYTNYSNTEYSLDLIELFKVIFAIFGKDYLLFDDLFNTVPTTEGYNVSFLMKLIESYLHKRKERIKPYM